MTPYLRCLTPLTAVVGLALLTGAAPAAATPVADHQLPLTCGETWTASTRAGHSPSVNAIDFNRYNDLRAPVVASAPGIVTTAQTKVSGGYGRWVVLDHGAGESSVYAHLSGLTVALGQRVDQGQMIGMVGSTGNSSGAHLHYEQKAGRTVEPVWIDGAQLTRGTVVSRNCVDVPLAGDFIGGKEAEVGVFRRTNRGSFRIHVPGSSPRVVWFGRGFEQPLVGDWDGDGTSDVGARNPRRKAFRLKTPSGLVKFRFGVRADQPVSGDWDGDGKTDVGVHRATTGTFLVRAADGTSSPVWLGDSDDIPVTGDWDGDGRTDLGVFDPSTATFTLRTTTPDGRSVIHVRQFGTSGDLPVAGDWDANGVTNIGTWTPSTATFRLQLAQTPTAARTEIRTFRFGSRR